MKKSLLILAFLAATFQLSFAGGNSSIVDLDKISSIKIESERIIIVGSGMLRKRVMSDAEHGDSSVFGQPAQMLHAKVTDCQFKSSRTTSGVTWQEFPDRDPITCRKK